MSTDSTQGRFVKAEAQNVIDATKEIMDAMPKKKLMEFLGHFNDVLLFLEAAKRAAPEG